MIIPKEEIREAVDYWHNPHVQTPDVITLTELIPFAELHLNTALAELGALCRNAKQFTMTIPVREDYDTDRIIGRALHDLRIMIELVKAHNT